MVDISKHSYVPKHVKLKESEVDDLLRKYVISLKQLPKISINDPAAKELNPKAGEVIKIIRKSPTAKESAFYRAVVE